MSIQHKMKIIHRLEILITELSSKYNAHSTASHELQKIQEALRGLKDYLQKLEQLQPNYTTNEVEKYVVTLNLNLDILKSEIERKKFEESLLSFGHYPIWGNN